MLRGTGNAPCAPVRNACPELHETTKRVLIWVSLEEPGPPCLEHRGKAWLWGKSRGGNCVLSAESMGHHEKGSGSLAPTHQGLQCGQWQGAVPDPPPVAHSTWHPRAALALSRHQGPPPAWSRTPLEMRADKWMAPAAPRLRGLVKQPFLLNGSSSCSVPPCIPQNLLS